jgi:hypothetical protein
MKMTLLEITQNILSAMDAEEVNSIGDTIESQQVADEIKTTYYANLSNFEIPSRFQLVSFQASGDSTNHPNVLVCGDSIDHFEWIKYNIATVAAPSYTDVIYLEPKEFLDRILMDSGGTRVAVTDISTDAPYTIRSDKAPDYWTTFDDENIVFDSFDAGLETNLQESKVVAYAEVLPTWTAADSFYPDLLAKYFPLLLSEAKASCFVNYKGVSNAKEELRARQQRSRLQNHRRRYNGSRVNSNFGRS